MARTIATKKRLEGRSVMLTAGLCPAWATCLIGCVALASCSLTRTYSKCGFSGCAGDAEITAEVRARLATKTGSIDVYVQTLDHVVYLYGIVDTDLDRLTMVDAARAVPGVTGVVESIGVRNGVY